MKQSGEIASWFGGIGAQAEVGEQRPGRPWQVDVGLTIDVVPTRRGERFQLLVHPDFDVTVMLLHASPAERHLVLLARDNGPWRAPLARPVDTRYLCGHDERHWFAAVVPAKRPVTTVRQAREALRPSIVRGSLLRHGVRAGDRDRRRNAGCIRQGDWFFVPRPDFTPPDGAILHDEPLLRGGGKPHLAQELYRSGGTQVYFPLRPLPPRHWHGPDPNAGLITAQMAQFLIRHPDLGGSRWRVRSRDPEAFVRGRIVHPDHRTVVLPFWHRVLPNTELRGGAAASLVFVD